MIPVLFKEDEQIFTHNGIGALYESLSCDVIEEENGAFTMELEYPVDGELFSELKDFRIIQAKPNDIDDPHNFRIYEIEKSIDDLTVYVRANTRTNDLGNNLITNYVGENVTPQKAMDGIKINLIEPTNFDLISDIETKSNVKWTRINPLNAIVGVRGSLVDIWGGQIKRTNNTIYLYSRRGRDNVVTIRPGKNIEGLNMTVSTAGLVTKILPTFSYSPVDVPRYQMVEMYDGTIEKQRVSTSGSTTLRDDITVIGDVVSSQYVDNYPTNYWSSVDYGDDDALKSVIDDYIDTRLTEAEESPTILDMSGFDQELEDFVKTELDKKANQYFTHRNPGADKPTVRIKVDMLQLSDSPDWEEFKDLERIGLTDTLDVWVEEYDIDVEVRVTSLTYDSIAEHVISFNAGSDRAPRQSAIEKKYDDLTQATNNYITSFKNGVRNIMRNTADGLNRKFEGYTEPPAELSSEGDIWFKQTGEGKVEIWIHDGVYWQPLLTEEFANKIEADIEAVQSELDEAKLQAIVDSEQALADAKAYAEAEDARIRGELESEIGGAIDLAEQAKQDAIDKANQALEDAKAHADAEIVLIGDHFDGIIEGVESDVADAKQTADDAIYKIDNDIADRFTGLDAEVLAIETISNTAQSNAQTALTQSLEALGDASTALTNAQTALDRADTAIGDASDAATLAGNALTKADEAQDTADILSGQVSGFETTVAGFNQTVNNYEGQVSGFRNDILGLESTVASYETEVDEFGNTVSTYATEVSTLTNTVSGFQSTVATYGQEVNSLTGEVATYATQVSNFSNTVDGLNNTVASYEVELDEYGNIVDTYATQVSNFSNTVSGFESTVATYGTEVSDLAGEVVGYQNQVSTLNNTVAGFNSTVASYTTEVNEFGLEVESYATEVSTLTNTVSGFQSTVSRVEQDYEDVSGTVATHTTQISNLDGEIALKANTTTVNTLTGRVSTAETGITANATAIGLKANTTTVNALTGRVSTAETGITANATAIGLKASQSSVDTLSGTVSSLGSDIGVVAGQISSKIWSTDIQTAVDGIEIGGRNYFVDHLMLDVNNYERIGSYYYYTINNLSPEEVYTVSVRENFTNDITIGSGANRALRINNDKADSLGVDIIDVRLSNGIRTYERQIRANEEGQLFIISYIPSLLDEIHNMIKLEKGTKATDWTPAPEDTTALINHVETELTQKYDSITATVSSIDGRVTTNTLDLDGLTTTVQDVRTDLTGTTTLLNTTKTTVDGHTSSISTLRTDVDGKATTAQFNTLTSTVNGTIQRVGDAEGNITQIETNVSGLQTTVAGKASQSEVTQLSTSLTSTITAVEGNTTQISQNTTNINLRVEKDDVINQINVSTEGILIDGNKTHITGTTTIDNGVIKNAHIGDLNASKINAGIINAARLDATAIVTAGLTANVIKSTHIETSTATVDKIFATDVMINRLTAKTAFINSIKAVDIDAARITSGTIKAARLDASAIVTAGLTAGVINGTHITADTALFDKLFSTSSATDRLSARTAWITNGMFTNASISGARITDASIASAKIASLDAAKISTGTLEGITINGVTITGSTYIQENPTAGSTHGRWDRRGITMRNASGSMIMDMNIEGLNFHGSGVSHSGTYINNELINVQNATIYDLTVTGYNARMNRLLLNGNLVVGNNATPINAGIEFRGTTTPAPLERMIWAGNGVYGNGVYTYFDGGWKMLQNRISNTTNITMNSLTTNSLTVNSTLSLTNRLTLNNSGIQFTGGSTPPPYERMIWAGHGSDGNGLYTYFDGWRRLQNAITSTSNITMNSLTTTSLTVNSSLILTNRLSLSNSGLQFSGGSIPTPVERLMWMGYGYDNNGLYFYLNGAWRKHGNTISDERFKENIEDTKINSLDEIMSWEFKDFDFKDKDTYGKGRKLGLIAQNTTQISNYFVDVDRWELDSQKQIMMNSHAIQQLALMEDNTNRVASQSLQLGESNKSEIDELREENKELRNRIEELESAM